MQRPCYFDKPMVGKGPGCDCASIPLFFTEYRQLKVYNWLIYKSVGFYKCTERRVREILEVGLVKIMLPFVDEANSLIFMEIHAIL